MSVLSPFGFQREAVDVMNESGKDLENFIDEEDNEDEE